MWVFKERGKPEYPGKKPLGARTRTNDDLNSLVVPTPGFELGPHWGLESDCSNQCVALTLAETVAMLSARVEVRLSTVILHYD